MIQRIVKSYWTTAIQWTKVLRMILFPKWSVKVSSRSSVISHFYSFSPKNKWRFWKTDQFWHLQRKVGVSTENTWIHASRQMLSIHFIPSSTKVWKCSLTNWKDMLAKDRSTLSMIYDRVRWIWFAVNWNKIIKFWWLNLRLNWNCQKLRLAWKWTHNRRKIWIFWKPPIDLWKSQANGFSNHGFNRKCFSECPNTIRSFIRVKKY